VTFATDTIVEGLHEVEGQLSGDDSPLLMSGKKSRNISDEASPYWPAYLEMVRQFTGGLIAELHERALAERRESLKCQSTPAVDEN
jgi:hypothetical protein